MVAAKQGQFDFKNVQEIEEEPDYVDIKEDIVMNQVERYIELSTELIEQRRATNLGYVDKGLKIVMLSQIIQKEVLYGITV